MKKLPGFAALLFLGSACLPAESPTIPDTPAGQVLRAWLEAFNSGDKARIQAYLAKYEPAKPLDPTMAFRNQTGGFELLGIDRSDPMYIDFRVREQVSPTNAMGRIALETGDPPKVASFSLRAIPPGMTAADMNLKVDGATRGRVIDGAIASLKEFYVYPDIAAKMEEDLRARQKKGEYDAVTDAGEFAATLTRNLQEVSHDKHLNVNFVPTVLPKEPPARTPEGDAQARAAMERSNCAFEKVEWLPPNIGYVKFNGFANPGFCGAEATAAMNFVANVDAIIFDVRDNGGGDPNMVAYLSTYLFDAPTHLNDLYNRREDSTTQYWTLPYVPGKRLTGKPVFVLTSKRTFSGAEEFSYNLQSLKRATIIGETTGGGAHPVSGHRIDDHFMIGVPFARAINPITKTNWEGKGVEPDVKAPAGEALDVAKKIAVEAIRKK